MFGKMKYVNKYLKEKVKEKKELFDYVYVNNFVREDEPISIVLKQGEAIKFKKDMKQYISYIKELSSHVSVALYWLPLLNVNI